MGDKKFPIRLQYQATVVGNVTGYVRSEIFHRNRLIACQSIAFRNRTGLRGNVEIFIKQQDFRSFICDQTTPALGRWYWYPYTQFIKEGEQIECEQLTCLNDDILDLVIVGYAVWGTEGAIP
ncbi:hypothetical protein ES703_45215 [subsurface metagenome]